MESFLNSNMFQSLVTIIVGASAFYLYKKQKKDAKTSAAIALYLEIQNIEANLPKVRDAVNNSTLGNLDVELIRANEWSKSNHIFSGDFDHDEWQLISDFYHHAKLIDEAIEQSKIAFADDINNIRQNKQRYFALLSKEIMEQKASSQESVEQVLERLRVTQDVFNKLYMSNQQDLTYTPVKYKDDAERSLSLIHNITTTTIGIKLKKIAKHK